MFHIKIYVPVKDKEGNWLPNDVIVVRSVLNQFMYGQQGKKSCTIHIDTIAYELYHTETLTTQQRSSIKKAFEKICSYEPEMLESLDKKHQLWKVYMNKCFRFNDKYIYSYAYNEDLYKIYNAEDTRVFSLGSFYYKFLSRFDIEYNVGWMSLDKFEEYLQMTKSTIQKNIAICKSVDALCVKTHRGQKMKDGTFYRAPNIYYRPIEEANVYKFMESGKISYFKPNAKPESA